MILIHTLMSQILARFIIAYFLSSYTNNYFQIICHIDVLSHIGDTPCKREVSDIALDSSPVILKELKSASNSVQALAAE